MALEAPAVRWCPTLVWLPMPHCHRAVLPALRRPTQNALEHVWVQLGEDQLLYSTNWPVSELNAPLATVAGIMNAFLQTKPKAARDKVLWKNSQAAYKWQPRQ